MIAFIRTFLLFSLFLFFPSCNSQKNPPIQQKKQILRTCLSSDIISLDPRKNLDLLTQGVVRSLFAGLTYLDKNLTPQLDLAKSYTVSEDLKTYTFHLRDSKWSDGSAITAKDFKESWKSLLNPAFAFGHLNPLYFMENGERAFSKECSIDDIGVSAPDDTTLIVKLEKPNPHFLEIISYVTFYPVHTNYQSSEIKDTTSIITSGPFVLKDYTFQNKITLGKNQYFWDARNIRLEDLQFFIIQDKQTAFFMFENKELDFFSEITTKITPNAIPSLIARNEFQEVNSAGTMFLFLNTQRFPLTNVNIRKALAYAIDRRSIMENILHIDSSNPALGIIPKIIKQERWHPLFLDNDVEKAKECFALGLKELGITKEEFPPLTMIHAGGASASSGLMEAIQQMWKRTLGCSIDCQSLDGPLLLSLIRSQNYDIGRLSKIMDYNAPAELLEAFTSKNSKTGYSGWSSEKYNKEATAARESDTIDEQWDHAEKAERIFCDAMPSIPLTNATASYVKHPYVQGVEVNALFLLNFRRTYIE